MIKCLFNKKTVEIKEENIKNTWQFLVIAMNFNMAELIFSKKYDIFVFVFA